MAAFARLVLGLSAFSSSLIFAAAIERGLVENPEGSNVALIVGVANGLQGIDLDVKMVEAIVQHKNYGFKTKIVENSSGTEAEIARNLTQIAEDARDDGTAFFYFSGHGSVGKLMVHNTNMKIANIRAALEKGRVGLGPLARLVLMFDSCYSGSLLDPVRALFPMTVQTEELLANSIFADSVVRELTGDREGQPYWQKLFVFASSRADQTSLASPDGSVFTLALKKAFGETTKSNETLATFVKKTQDYTKGHNPVARFVPASLADEKMFVTTH